LSNGTLFSKHGSIKERTQTSTEIGISCQRNGYWPATNHLSGRGLVQPIKELSSVAGRCAGRGCALIRQLANVGLIVKSRERLDGRSHAALIAIFFTFFLQCIFFQRRSGRRRFTRYHLIIVVAFSTSHRRHLASDVMNVSCPYLQGAT